MLVPRQPVLALWSDDGYQHCWCHHQHQAARPPAESQGSRQSLLHEVGKEAVMTLSVIIPVYGVEHTLNRCVESVVRQTFDDWEIILVDDGSPDDSPRLCDEWAARDSRIHVIHQKNGGLSSARNAGIDAAQGRYVTFLDSDDYLDTDTYRHVIPLMDQADIVEFPFYRFFGSQRQCLVSFSPTSCSLRCDSPSTMSLKM